MVKTSWKRFIIFDVRGRSIPSAAGTQEPKEMLGSNCKPGTVHVNNSTMITTFYIYFF